MSARRLVLVSLVTGLCGAGCSDGHAVAERADAGGDSESDPSAGECAGRPGKLRGKSNQQLSVGPLTRSFVYYAPADLDPEQPAPLVIAVHGFAMSGETMFSVTGFKELADREGFVAVFPDGASFTAPWNVGTGVTGVGASLTSTVDDQAFLAALQEFADQDQCLDRAHVFVSGFSMGGYFANESGCLRDDLAAIAPHSGGTHDLSACPGAIRPVILFHGDADGVVSYAENGLVARDRWLARNGCDAEFDAEPVKGGSCEYYRGCPKHAQVALCRFEGMEHKWAGGNDPNRWYGDPDRQNAAELAWSFWQKYAW
jgi:polyhydroxybutyrate depolymerase